MWLLAYKNVKSVLIYLFYIPISGKSFPFLLAFEFYVIAGSLSMLYIFLLNDGKS